MSAQKEEENVQHFSCPYPTYPFKLEDLKEFIWEEGDMYHCFYMPSYDGNVNVELLLPCGRIVVVNKHVNGWKNATSAEINLRGHKEAVYLGICVLHRKL